MCFTSAISTPLPNHPLPPRPRSQPFRCTYGIHKEMHIVCSVQLTLTLPSHPHSVIADECSRPRINDWLWRTVVNATYVPHYRFVTNKHDATLDYTDAFTQAFQLLVYPHHITSPKNGATKPPASIRPLTRPPGRPPRPPQLVCTPSPSPTTISIILSVHQVPAHGSNF